MTLIKSISGIRGTIGGKQGDNLTPTDIVKFASAYATWAKRRHSNSKEITIVVGRDARISGKIVQDLVIATLKASGIDVLNLDLSTTPTVEMAVIHEKAHGGIIITASHNPKQWNALKLLNEFGEFISEADGAEVLRIASSDETEFVTVDELGKEFTDNNYIEKHIQKILDIPLVNKTAISNAKLRVVIDCVNSTGGIALPPLLKALGVSEIIELYTSPNGHFPHNPEPLPEHLGEICSVVKERGAHLGIVVDPDVDRLALINEDGTLFGEEYTLVAVADYVLNIKPGNTVSNLSSTRALRKITESRGLTYTASAVGEVNVVRAMKDTKAVIGGEGNGGIILPDLHYGRDALVGIALFLSHLANSGLKMSTLRATYPNYFISKNKIELTPGIDVDKVLENVGNKYSHHKVTTIDGVKIDFDNEWVHLRKSNTEPIIRIYSESSDEMAASKLAKEIIQAIQQEILLVS